MKLIIKNGVVCDPESKFFSKANVFVENGKIVKITSSLSGGQKGKIIDANGKIVTPGLIDIHTHSREPGREDEETIKSITRAAASGGFTTICVMPNTQPVIDSVAGVKFIITTASQEGLVNVYPIGAITKSLEGLELAEIGKMKNAGIVGISDDGKSVMNAQVMRHALEYSRMFDLVVISHCEDVNLSASGVMNEGYTSTLLGLRGIPAQAEEIMVARDIALSELTGARLHIAHVSTAGSVELVRAAKKRNLKVTCEVTPHHFSLTEESVRQSNYNTNTKVNPPLRTKKDVKALLKGLLDGTIDCIVSDHAPHLREEKEQEYNLAPFGIVGLETTLPLVITNLVKKKILKLPEAIAKMTVNPARIINLPSKGSLAPGKDADITIIDLKQTRTIEKFESKCSNSPFIGMKLTGFATMTIVGGKIVMENGKIIPV